MEDKAKTCGECRWWEGNDMHPSPFGVPFLTVSEKFGSQSLWRCRNADYAKDSGGPYYIETAPDFGCIHWQEKEPF